MLFTSVRAHRALSVACLLLCVACTGSHKNTAAQGGQAGATATGGSAGGSGDGGGGDNGAAGDASLSVGGSDQPFELQVRERSTFNLDWKYFGSDAKGAEGFDYDDSAWKYVDLPHGTKFVTPDAPNAYLGVSWYRKRFSVPDSARGRKVYVAFGAAMQIADIWVNGVQEAHHEGGYTPFLVDVSDVITFGDEASNVLAVKLDSNANVSFAPGWNGVDFQYHGGLYRNVELLTVSRLHVTDPVYSNRVAGGGVFVTYADVSADAAIVNIKTELANESPVPREATLVSELIDPDGELAGFARSTETISSGTERELAQEISVSNPFLWHPRSPHLYTLRTRVLEGDTPVDDLETRVGIRRIDWSHDEGLGLNGERFTALGANLHQELYGLGNAVPDRAIYYDVKRLKDAGLDFVRGSHYPHAPAFYDACDELGILVLDAQTGWQNFSNSDKFKNNTYQELRDMIRRDRNHPSVVAWEASLNESNFSDAWAQTANEVVHAEYPGDQAFSVAWRGTFADIFGDASQHGVRSSTTTRPIIINEYGDWDYGGADSTSRQPREGDDAALLKQANNIEQGTSNNLALPWYSLGGYWAFADYAGFSNYGITRAGLVDMYRLPKFSYYFLRSQRDADQVSDAFDSGPMVFIANRWTPDSPTTVRVYSNCEQVALYLNDELLEERPPDAGTHLRHPPFNFDVGSFTPGTLRADCSIDGHVVATHSRRTPGDAAALVLRPEATTLLADASDARLVFIDVVDANGTVVPSDASTVTLEVSGPGSVVGPSEVTMKGGQLATWVRSTRVAGTVTLNARAEGLSEARIELTSDAVDGLPPVPVGRN